MSSAKVREADMLVEEAKKHLKTGFFKWRPDYDSAASSFQKAAVAYRNAKAFENSYTTFLSLADCYIKNGSRFHAGKAYEEAGQVQFKDLKDPSKGLTCFDSASELYLEDGTPDTAAMCMDRAGKIVQTSHPEWAIASYMKAAEIYENEDQNRFRTAAEMIGKVARLQVTLQKYSEAIKSNAHEQKLWSQAEGSDHGARARLTCVIVLLHLQVGDQVRAEQSLYDACENVDGFDESEEYDALQKVLEAYDQRNQEEVSRLMNLPLFKYMDTAYAKLARSLAAPGYSNVSSRSTGNQQALASGTGYNSTNEQKNNVGANLASSEASPNEAMGAAGSSEPVNQSNSVNNGEFDLC